MKPNDNLANHIGMIEVLAHQLNDLGELLSNRIVMINIV
jgi:hypothetical protein